MRDVAQELIDAAVSERMNQQGSAAVNRQSRDVGAGNAARAELRRRLRVRGEDIALGIACVERGANLTNDADAVLAARVQLIDEHDHRARSGANGQ